MSRPAVTPRVLPCGGGMERGRTGRSGTGTSSSEGGGAMSAEREDGDGDAGGGGAGSGGAGSGEAGGRARRSGGGVRRDDGRSLVLAMRRGEAAAFTAFVERYQRLLLHYAARAGLRGGDADELVTTVLGDAVIAFLEPRARMPDDVAFYLIGCFRHRMLNERRDGERRARRVREAAAEGDWGDGVERAALCSEDARRASRGPEWDAAAPPTAAGLTALARRLSESLTDDERRMLAWDSEDVPQREIAVRLGITHAAVRQRLRRLRARLRAASEQYAAALDGDGGRVVRRFLRRSLGAPPPRAVASQPSMSERARRRRAEPGSLADGAGQEPRGEGGPNDE